MDRYYFYMECDIQGQQYFIYNGMQGVWVTVKLYSWFITLNSLLQNSHNEEVAVKLV